MKLIHEAILDSFAEAVKESHKFNPGRCHVNIRKIQEGYRLRLFELAPKPTVRPKAWKDRICSNCSAKLSWREYLRNWAEFFKANKAKPREDLKKAWNDPRVVLLCCACLEEAQKPYKKPENFV